MVDCGQRIVQRAYLCHNVGSVLGQQSRSFWDRRVALSHELGEPFHLANRERRRTKASQNLDPGNVVLAVPTLPAGRALDRFEQTFALVVTQRVD